MNTLFTRVIMRRNFAGFPFWVSCPPEACARLRDRAREHAAARGYGTAVTLADQAPNAIGLLRERLRLPERPGSFPGKRDFKMLFTGADPEAHALFGEAEHWIEIRTFPGLPSAPETLGNLVLEEEKRDGGPVFSRSSEWGYLTSDPVFAGSGLQFDAGLHLPALAAARKFPQLQQAMAAMGLELRPLSLRNPGAAEAGFFRLLSRGGADLSGEGLHRRFADRVNALLAAEASAWERWRAREPRLLEDRMHRALRLLQEARRMELPEALRLISFARAGVYAGLFPAALLPRLEELRVKAQPFHASAHAGAQSRAQAQAGADPEAEHAGRAALARTLLSQT